MCGVTVRPYRTHAAHRIYSDHAAKHMDISSEFGFVSLPRVAQSVFFISVQLHLGESRIQEYNFEEGERKKKLLRTHTSFAVALSKSF